MRSKFGSPSFVDATRRLPVSEPPGGLDSKDGPGHHPIMAPGRVRDGHFDDAAGHTEGFQPTGNGSLMATSSSHAARHRW